VHVTVAGCAGIPNQPAGSLVFLGPDNWVGSGGGGISVDFTPHTGHQATATFTIPATYTGGYRPGPNPTLAVKAGSGYYFATYPVGLCSVRFTVLAS
jgi:hypothetical protein